MLLLKSKNNQLPRPAFWLVFTCYSKRNYLRNPEYLTQINKILLKLGEKLQFKVNALTFTPKQMLLIVTPFKPQTLEKIIYQLQRQTGRYMREFLELPTALWDGKPMSRKLNTTEELSERKKYLHSLKSLDLP